MATGKADMADRKRRQYKTGSVYQKTDGRWAGVMEAGYTETGARRRVTVTGKTKGEVERKLRDKIADQERIKRQRRPTRTFTVKAWADEWLEMTERELRPKTWATNRSQVRLWIIPTIGHIRLNELQPADLRDLAATMRRKGKSPATITRTRGVAIKMLKDAIVEGHPVDGNIVTAAPRKKQSRKHDREAMEVDEALAVIDQANLLLPHASRWHLAFLQGLRQGESLGTERSAADIETGLLDVAWQLQALPYVDPTNKHLGFRIPDDYDVRHLTGAFHLVPTKTSGGERIIPFVEWAIDSLSAWYDIAPPSPHGLIWTRPDGRPIDAAADRAEFKMLQDKAGVRHPSGRHYHVHEIRNTTATLLLEAGVDPFIITAIMGHTDIETSRAYMRLRAAKSREAMAAVGEQLRPRPLPQRVD